MTKGQVFDRYVDLAKRLGRTPTESEYGKEGIGRPTIRHHWNTVVALDAAAREIYPELFEDVPIELALGGAAAIGGLRKRYVVTTAVVGARVHLPFLTALQAYCRRVKAELLILVCADPAARKSPGGAGYLDKLLRDLHIVANDLDLGAGVRLHKAKMSAKQINPTTGLGRLAKGVEIYASPKQFYVALPSFDPKTLRAVMTPGAVTLPAYETDRYMSLRLSEIAAEDHMFGALIVEVASDKVAHVRQVQTFSDDGSFYDLGTRHRVKSSDAVRASAVQPGDIHVGHTDPAAWKAIREVCQKVRPHELIHHDLWNGDSSNHHDQAKIIMRARKHKSLSRAAELKRNAKFLNDCTRLAKTQVVVHSNHNQWLTKALEKEQSEPQNYRLDLDLRAALHDGKNPLQVGVERFGAPTTGVLWLGPNDSHIVAGIECGAHGHLGPNGSRGGTTSLAKVLGNANTGHTHTPGIINGLFTAGTSTPLREEYNEGPSSWRQALIITYPDGGRQIIDHTNGKWRLT